jgi:addiction module RelE/StbE family toxin
MMKIKYSPAFIEKLKKVDVRIRKSFKERIQLFENDPNYPQLNNHDLRDEYEGFRSIDITADYRAIFKIVTLGNESFAYFSLLGTHEELYQTKKA